MESATNINLTEVESEVNATLTQGELALRNKVEELDKRQWDG